MQLKMSLPERPGWIFVIPGFDFMALLLALVMFSGVVAKESYVEIKLPPSEFRGVRLGDENPVVVMLKGTASGSVYYVDGVKVSQASLGGLVLESAEKRGTKAVAIKVDSGVTMAARQVLINTIAKLNGIRIFEGYRRKEEVEKVP
jgi:biopolymer transport protein ExbD